MTNSILFITNTIFQALAPPGLRDYETERSKVTRRTPELSEVQTILKDNNYNEEKAHEDCDKNN